MKLTYQDKITLFLHDQKGQWVESFKLGKVHTKWGWIGSSGERRAREIAEKGIHITNGIKYYIEHKIENGYAWYRCTGGEKDVILPRFEEKNGQRVVKLTQETLKV